MKKNVIRKLVSVLICVSIVAGFTSVSNAYIYIIQDSSSSYVTNDYASADYSNYFIYDIAHIQVEDMPAGSFVTGLRLRADLGNDSDWVCNINCYHDAGYYDVNTSGDHVYRLYNSSGKKITLNTNYIYV